jgi:hypothetical protein
VLAAVAAAALCLVSLLGVRLVAAGGPSGLVVAGEAFVHPDRPADLAVVNEGTGYDGQFVYRMTLDPFPDEPTAYGITLDNPPYRAQRVGLPLAAHALTRAGVPASVALILVNVLALLGATAAAAALARRWGRHALWGVVVGLSPALVISFTRDLTEPLATALLLAGLVAWPRRPVVAAAAFTAAVLTRETVLVVLAGLGLHALWQALRARTPDTAPRRAAPRRAALARAALLLVPLTAFVAWQAYLRSVWGEPAVAAAEGTGLGTPFLRPLSVLFAGADLTAWGSRDAVLENVWLAERVAFLALLLHALWRVREVPALAAPLAAATLLATSTAWHRDVAFLRAGNEALVVALLVLVAAGARRPLAATAAASAGVAVLYGAFL